MKDINNFYSDVDVTLGKSKYYTIVMEDFSAQIGAMETATGTFGLGLRK